MENAGLSHEAAEAVADAIRAGQGEHATKADLDVLQNATQADLAAVEARMTWRIVLAQAAQGGFIVALLK